MPGKIDIQTISADQTWLIRQAVMWPTHPLSFVQLPNDEQGLHFGALLNHRVVSVVSLFTEGGQAQFRKFATLQEFQGRGYGRALLKHVFAIAAANQNVSSVWCHARSSAQGFYQRMGMHPEGANFNRDGLEYIKMRLVLHPSG
ncbi:GNAT family N-acetyltransferase [Rufibacter soli]